MYFILLVNFGNFDLNVLHFELFAGLHYGAFGSTAALQKDGSGFES